MNYLRNSGKKSYGFIAQELEKYIPEAVILNDVDHYKTVEYDIAYAKILAAFAYKIKQLESKIKE